MDTSYISKFYLIFSVAFLILFHGQSLYGMVGDGRGVPVLEIDTHSVDPSIKKIVREILEVYHLENLEVNVAEAKIDGVFSGNLENKYFIIYNEKFIDSTSIDGGKWFKYLVFAHEIGHRVFGNIDFKASPKDEFIVNKWSGSILHKLGATLTETQYLTEYLKKLKNKNITYSPSESNAIIEGWNEEKDPFISSKWFNISLLVGLGILFLNILLLLLAIPFKWFRRIVFSGDIVDILGLFTIKGVVTKPLLQSIKPVKLALLKDYRKEILNIPYLKQWKANKRYYSPQIGELFHEKPINNLWNTIYSSFRKTRSSTLWIIEGRSGLGKTALIEQLTLIALEENQTPILIKLGSQPLTELIRRMFEDYGDLVVSTSVAESMIKEGGFIILLDGLNEAQDQEQVRLFVKSIIRKNIVIVSSQFLPQWADIQTNKIVLQPFGEKQLVDMIENTDIVCKLKKATYLFDVYPLRTNLKENLQNGEIGFLPFTASLVRDFIKKNHGEIPENRLSIYETLLEPIDSDPAYLNLKKKSWEMFCDNSQNIEPDSIGQLDIVFLDMAKESELLSVFTVNSKTIYRFRHERIFRYVVASYLFKYTELLNIDELHKLLTQGQDRLHYWADVIEFIGEFYCKKIKEGDDLLLLAAYKSFMIAIGEFEPLILKKRLYQQWQLLFGNNAAFIDYNFERRILEIIIGEGQDV